MTLLISLKNNEPIKQIIADGQIDQCTALEKMSKETIGVKITYKIVNTAELATSVYSSDTCCKAWPVPRINPKTKKYFNVFFNSKLVCSIFLNSKIKKKV